MAEDNGIETVKVYRDIETDLMIQYHPSTPFVFEFVTQMRKYYSCRPEEVMLTDINAVVKK